MFFIVDVINFCWFELVIYWRLEFWFFFFYLVDFEVFSGFMMRSYSMNYLYFRLVLVCELKFRMEVVYFFVFRFLGFVIVVFLVEGIYFGWFWVGWECFWFVNFLIGRYRSGWVVRERFLGFSYLFECFCCCEGWFFYFSMSIFWKVNKTKGEFWICYVF